MSLSFLSLSLPPSPSPSPSCLSLSLSLFLPFSVPQYLSRPVSFLSVSLYPLRLRLSPPSLLLFPAYVSPSGWTGLVTAVNDSAQLEKNWFRLTVIDKIMCLHDKEVWRCVPLCLPLSSLIYSLLSFTLFSWPLFVFLPLLSLFCR